MSDEFNSPSFKDFLGEGEESKSERKPKEKLKEGYKILRYNAVLSGIMVLVLLLFSILMENSFIILIFIPILSIIFYIEYKARYYLVIDKTYLILLNSSTFLFSICFGILTFIPWNIQLIVFLLALYFLLEVFVNRDLFAKESVEIVQNILAVAIFFLIVYMFTPLIMMVNELIRFTSDPLVLLMANIFLDALLFFVVLQFSFYRFFEKKEIKAFRYCVITNLFLIDMMLYILINYIYFFLIDFILFINILIFSTLLFPLLLILFVLINFLANVIPLKTFLSSVYYSCWFLNIIFITGLIIIYTNIIGVLLTVFIIALLLIQLNIRFGVYIEKIGQKFLRNYNKITSYLIAIDLFILNFLSFYYITSQDIILTIFFSLLIISIFVTILSGENSVFPKSLRKIINTLVLFFPVYYTCYFSIVYTYGQLFIFYFPLMTTCLVLHLPICYLFVEKVISRKTLINYRYYSSFIIVISLYLIFCYIQLQFYYFYPYPGLLLASLFLSLAIYFIILYGAKRGKISLPKYKKISQVIYYAIALDLFCLLYSGFVVFLDVLISFYWSLLIATIIIYIISESEIFFSEKLSTKLNELTFIISPFIVLIYSIVFVSSFYVLIVPLMLFCGTAFLPLYYFERRAIDKKFSTDLLIANSIILALCFLSVPWIISMELLSLGNPVNFITVFNYSLYILIVILCFSYLLLYEVEEEVERIKKIQQYLIIIGFILAFSTAFYYPYLYLFESNPFYGVYLALFCFSIFLFLPCSYSNRKGHFNKSLIKNLIIINFLFLLSLIIAIPWIVGFELSLLGMTLDFITLFNLSLFILIVILIITFISLYDIELREESKQRDKNIKTIVKTLNLLGFVVSFSVIFYYPFILIIKISFWYSILLGALACSSFLFIPSYWAYKQ